MVGKDSIWYKIMIYGLEFLGKYYGKYRAFVVDNEDPNGCNRLRMLVPHLDNITPDDTWAWPASSWGGKDYGVQILPMKGDMVWVEYEYGNPDYPIWSHASYARDEKPKEFDTTKHYGFKTPSGTLVVINDNVGEEEILVRHNSRLEWLKITKEEVEFEAKLIKLGKKGEEPAIMGDTYKKTLENIMEQLDKTYNALLKHTHPSSTGPTGMPINTKEFEDIKKNMGDIKGTFKEFLSTKVKLDK